MKEYYGFRTRVFSHAEIVMLFLFSFARRSPARTKTVNAIDIYSAMIYNVKDKFRFQVKMIR